MRIFAISIYLLFVLVNSAFAFDKVMGPREFTFPRDHGSHESYRIEWWYVTGNLQGTNIIDPGSKRRFGYQVTFFRIAHPNKEVHSKSNWSANQLYAVHLAVSDIDKGKYYNEDDIARPIFGEAGASSETLHVWLRNWSMKLRGEKLTINANTERFSLQLQLDASGEVLLQGDNGYSQKGKEIGNASYYYSIPRMATKGNLEVAGKSFIVDGSSWLDHEFGSSFLEPGTLGWDWFSIQLDDESNIMLFQLRDKSGNATFFSGTVDQKGQKPIQLKSGDFTLSPSQTWKSKNSGGIYPISWDIKIPPLAISLNVKSAIPNQEFVSRSSLGINYWEGLIEVSGIKNDTEVSGLGYLEMTGYGGESMSEYLSSQ